LVVAAIGFVLGYALSRVIGVPLRRLLFRRRERLRAA
jgi:adenine/guanine phosphoribosyltransferase-like PRPP-binding protein